MAYLPSLAIWTAWLTWWFAFKLLFTCKKSYLIHQLKCRLKQAVQREHFYVIHLSTCLLIYLSAHISNVFSRYWSNKSASLWHLRSLKHWSVVCMFQILFKLQKLVRLYRLCLYSHFSHKGTMHAWFSTILWVCSVSSPVHHLLLGGRFSYFLYVSMYIYSIHIS